jgi:hypothetical protein
MAMARGKGVKEKRKQTVPISGLPLIRRKGVIAKRPYRVTPAIIIRGR